MQPYNVLNIVLLLLCFPLGIRTATKTITLFAVEDETISFSFPGPTISNFRALSAQGVGADGATTYVEEDRISQIGVAHGQGVFISGSVTHSATFSFDTITIPTRTELLTVVADDSHYRFTQLPHPTTVSGLGIIGDLGIIQSCSIDSGGGTGSCVAVVWDDEGAFGSQTSMSTMTTTFSGSLVPIATLTVDSDTPNKQDNGALMSHPTWVSFGYGLFIVVMLCTVLIQV